MTEKQKIKDKDKKHDKEAKRGKVEKEKEKEKVKQKDKDRKDKDKEKSKEKEKKEEKKRKEDPAEPDKAGEPDKATTLEKLVAAQKVDKPAEPAEKKLKAWQDDVLEVDSGDEAKEGSTRQQAISAAAADSGHADGAGEKKEQSDEPDPLDAFMADLAKAPVQPGKRKAGDSDAAKQGAGGEAGASSSSSSAMAAGGGMGVMDSSPVRSITLEEIQALMGPKKDVEAAASSASATDAAAAGGASAAAGSKWDIKPADSKEMETLERQDSSEEEAFHAAFLAEIKKLRGEGQGPEGSAAQEATAANMDEVPKKVEVSKEEDAKAAKETKGEESGSGSDSDSSSGESEGGDQVAKTDEQPTDDKGGSEVTGLSAPGETAPVSEEVAAQPAGGAGADAAASGTAAVEAAGGAAAAPEAAIAAEAAAAQPAVKEVLTKKEKRRRRREQKEAEQKVKEAEKKVKAKEGFGRDEDGEQLMENDAERSEESEEEVQESYFDLVKRYTTKKSLPPVDHSKIEYPAFRKNLYIQVKEITSMKDHEVEDWRRTQGDIKVRGKHCPRPIKSFLQCGLPEKILKIMEKREYELPFPIQMQAIPALMCGRDLIGVAQTGSGKTLAYLLPLVRHIQDQPKLKDGDGPIGFVIAPTRELALQIQREANVFCKAAGLSSVCAYGGGPMGEQLSALKKGAELLVGTPGRLIDVLTINRGGIANLRRVTFLVLDEADRMFDMGFEPQIGMFLQNTRPDKQVALFSATLPSHVEALARTVLKRPLEITVGERNTAATNVTQFVEVTEESQKFYRLLQLLGEWQEHGSIIIFVHQQKEVDEMFTELLKFGYPTLSLHGGQDQQDRDFTLADFKDGVSNILIATSVAARGIDVKQVILVINFKVPDHLEDYIHRIGRTGRAGKQGFAYTFIQPDEGDKAQDMSDALRQCGQAVPEKLKALVEVHQVAVNAGQAKKRRRWGGFGGKGYKYDNTEKSQQQRDRINAKKDMLIGDAGERDEEEDKYKDSWEDDKPMSKGAQAKAEKDEAKGKGKGEGKGKAAPSGPSDTKSTAAAAAAVAAKMQAEAAKAAGGKPLAPGVGNTPADFIPSNAFIGARPGMSFKSGPQGLGYYRDAPAETPGGMLALANHPTAPGSPPASSPPPPGGPPKAKAGGPFINKTDQELEEQAQRMAEETLKTALEGENAEQVREKQLPALAAKLKEKLRKAQEEQASMPPPSMPPPPPKEVVPEKQEPVMLALPLVPGVLGGGQTSTMVLKSMEEIQKSLAASQKGTAKEAQEMAQMLQGDGPIAAAGQHIEEFEINDYPTKARQQISHRDPLNSIEEMTGARCWVKGQHFLDERKMPEGARKLYVEIIGPTVISVQKAKNEVRKMMEALAIRTLNIPGVSRNVMGTPGRYDPTVGK